MNRLIIFIVDDEPTNLSVLSQTLVPGSSVRARNFGISALQVLTVSLDRILRRHPQFSSKITDRYDELVTKSALLHDIGKVGILNHILQNRGTDKRRVDCDENANYI